MFRNEIQDFKYLNAENFTTVYQVYQYYFLLPFLKNIWITTGCVIIDYCTIFEEGTLNKFKMEQNWESEICKFLDIVWVKFRVKQDFMIVFNFLVILYSFHNVDCNIL